MEWDPRRRSKRRRSRRIRLLVAVLGLAIALFGLVKLIGYGADLLAARRAARELRQAYYAAPTPEPLPATETAAATPAPTMMPTPAVTAKASATPTQSPIPRLPSRNYPGNPNLTITSRFKALQKESKYIIGWLSIRRMLEEAVVQRDNVFYLDHDVLGNSNANGALFLDSAIGLKTRPYSYIIYGHNMKSGAMFGNLRSYENSTFYHNDPFISFDTLYESGRYVVFAVGTVSTEETGDHYVDFFSLRSSNIAERQAAIDVLKEASVHTCTVDVQADDQLLILVTCVGKDEDRRVVAARRLRDGESETELKKQVEKSQKKQ